MVRKAAILTYAALAAGTLPLPVLAQSDDGIYVAAIGSVETPPDQALITYTLRGEGASSDEALKQLNTHRAAIDAAIASLLKSPPQIEAGQLTMKTVRGKDCTLTLYAPARLSTNECAILGYTAELAVTLRTRQIADAGTLTGLISRNHGLDARVAQFELSDTGPAQKEAMRRALAQAHEQAELIAQNSGARLGPVQRIRDGDYRDLTANARAVTRPAYASRPAPPPPPPPIAVALKPAPIETSVKVMVVYALLP